MKSTPSSVLYLTTHRFEWGWWGWGLEVLIRRGVCGELVTLVRFGTVGQGVLYIRYVLGCGRNLSLLVLKSAGVILLLL